MEINEFFLNLKPYSTALHVLGAIIGMGAALASDIMFSFYSRDRVFSAREKKTLEQLSRIIWIALATIIMSGLALFLSDPTTYAASPKFLTKMTIVGILTLNGYVLARWIQPHIARGNFLTSKKEQSARVIAFVCGAVSLVSWCSTFGLGMIEDAGLSYTTLVLLYVLILVCATIGALLIERLKFE